VGEAAAVSRTARADTRRTVARRRAVGTRDRIVAHLALVAEIADGTGMASTRLAEAVGYPGSSVAFAQLLSGMERDGLISREVRGKRTYRITLSAPSAARRATASVGSASVGSASVGSASVGTASVGTASAGSGPAGSGAASTGPVKATAEDGPLPLAVAFPGTVDYDDLADRVIVRLLRRIAELNPAELAALERLIVPGRARPEELKIV
jgi:hypothetical protein